ncbi:MAG: ABC transporter ATP-binding protein [Alphaproteobacteria bacterium]|nr:MAG: ABC transporter ATP-binding protein [Alphaproteobacteria bacterium]
MLELQGVCKHFGGLTAVDRVSFSLGEEAITGLVGPNGSGKTTLFHVISGFYSSDGGSIHFHGVPIHNLPPHEISRLGLVRTFQHSRVVGQLSVRDNLKMAAPQQLGENLSQVFFRRRAVRCQERQIDAQAKRILDLLKLDHLAEQPAEGLSYGQQKLLELGRVLMAEPRLVLLDEPTAGVNPTLIRRIVAVIQRLAQEGIRFFLVEHNMPLVAELCQRVLVMDAGELIFDGSAAAARQDERVIEAYLGRVDAARGA